METINKDDILFYISKETLQYEAMEKIGRSLTEEELDIAKEWLFLDGTSSFEFQDLEYPTSKSGYHIVSPAIITPANRNLRTFGVALAKTEDKE